MDTACAPHQPAAVLWDMDGTIVDSEPVWIETELEMLERYGLTLTPEIERALIGSGLTAAARMFQSLGVPLSVDEILAEWSAGVIRRIRETEPAWMPGAIEMLTSLREQGIPCALVTMSLRNIVDSVFARLPEGLFQVVVAGDEVEHEKPHPDPYLRGAAALGVDATDCLAFEDSPTGVRSAAAAGAVTVGLPHQVPLEGTPAHELWLTLDGKDAHSVTETWARHRLNRDRSEERE